MFNVIDETSNSFKTFFKMFGRDNTYRLNPTGETATVQMFLRGVSEDDLFAGAMQQDQVAIFIASDWVTAFPSRTTPARLDRIITATGTFAIEQWRGSPNDGSPVFIKTLLRGGSQ